MAPAAQVAAEPESSVLKFKMFPWIGGLNTSLDPSTVPANQLLAADNILFGVRGSRKKRDGINHNWDTATTGTESIIGQLDYWYGATPPKTNIRLAVADSKNVYSYTTGTQSANLFAGTAWSSAITTACVRALNNLAIIAVDGSGNVMKKWTGSGNIADLGGTPPQASICGEHLGRLFTNDKTNLDRLQYCSTGNPEEWQGNGDSGAIDIGIGDGDPDGITAFWSFKRNLFIAKRTKLYAMTGDTPETFDVQLVSNGIGCVAHDAVATMDQDDVFFVSERGVHSLNATINFGDFQSQYVSLDVQNTFNTQWLATRRKFIKAVYWAYNNSLVFGVTDSTIGTASNNCLYLYNIALKSWYRWPNLPCQSVLLARDSDQPRLYLGRNDARISQTATGANYDTSTSGVQTGVVDSIITPIIHPGDDPDSLKAFKYFGLIYKPIGTQTITVSVQVDNQAAQALAYSQSSTGALLDTTFVLDQSVLDAGLVTNPYTQLIDGYGRGAQISISQSGVNEQSEIQGFVIGYEDVGHFEDTTS